MQPTLQDYESTVENLVVDSEIKSPSEQKIFPIIDPRISLPNSFPDISEIVKKLGNKPYGSTKDEDELTIHFPGGDVSYSLLKEQGYYVPNRIIVFGVQTEWSRQAIKTERFNTEVLIYPLEDGEFLNEDDNLFVIGDGKKDIFLKIEVFEGENKVPHDWWISDKIERMG